MAKSLGLGRKPKAVVTPAVSSSSNVHAGTQIGCRSEVGGCH